jgi:hypothetical protein
MKKHCGVDFLGGRISLGLVRMPDSALRLISKLEREA